MIRSSTPAAICIQAYLQVCSFHPAVASTLCPLSSTVSARTSSCQFSQLLCSLAALLQLHLHLRNPRRMKQILQWVIHHQWPKLFGLFPIFSKIDLHTWYLTFTERTKEDRNLSTFFFSACHLDIKWLMSCIFISFSSVCFFPPVLGLWTPSTVLEFIIIL